MLKSLSTAALVLTSTLLLSACSSDSDESTSKKIGPFQVQTISPSGPDGNQYLIYVPGATAQATRAQAAQAKPALTPAIFPVIVYLHDNLGGAPTLEKLADDGLLKSLRTSSLNAVVVAPFSRSGWHHPAQVDAVLKDAYAKKYAYTQEHHYIVGKGQGGSGLWNAIVTHPTRFQAGLSVAGMHYNDYLAGVNHKAASSAFDWAFAFNPVDYTFVRSYHGDADEVIPLSHSQNATNYFNNAGGHADLQIVPGATHSTVDEKAFAAESLNWLLQQSTIPVGTTVVTKDLNPATYNGTYSDGTLTATVATGTDRVVVHYSGSTVSPQTFLAAGDHTFVGHYLIRFGQFPASNIAQCLTLPGHGVLKRQNSSASCGG